MIQTGFNAGHSADIILGFRPACKLISFQLLAAQQTMTRKMTLEGAKFVATKYTERHSLIYGDSQKTLQRFIEKYNDLGNIVDVAFIDGVTLLCAVTLMSCALELFSDHAV